MIDHVFFNDMIKEIYRKDLINFNKFAVKLYYNNDTIKRMPNYPNMEIIPRNYNLHKISKGYDKIIFHNLFIEDISQLSRFHKRGEKIVWRQWSGDTFNILKEANRFKNYNINSKFIKDYEVNSLLEKKQILIYNAVIKTLLWSKSAIKYYQIKNALSKIDIVGNWNAFETDQIKALYPSFKAKYFYSAYTKPDMTKVKKPLLKNGTNKILKIFLGHNGYLDVNYKEIIDFLFTIKKSHMFNVTCVLSYGDPEYIQFISKYGKEKLGERFSPLVDFMDTDQYYAMFDSYDVFIFNSSLQTGAGNVHQALMMGKKVFLREENPLYCHFKQQELVFFSVNMLLKDISLLADKFSLNDRYSNFKILTASNVQERFDKEMRVFIE